MVVQVDGEELRPKLSKSTQQIFLWYECNGYINDTIFTPNSVLNRGLIYEPT